MSQSKLFDTFQIFLPQSVAATSYNTSLVLEILISSLMGEYAPDIRALSICIPAFCLKNKTSSLHFWLQKTYVENVNSYHKIGTNLSKSYKQNKQYSLPAPYII